MRVFYLNTNAQGNYRTTPDEAAAFLGSVGAFLARTKPWGRQAFHRPFSLSQDGQATPLLATEYWALIQRIVCERHDARFALHPRLDKIVCEFVATRLANDFEAGNFPQVHDFLRSVLRWHPSYAGRPRLLNRILRDALRIDTRRFAISDGERYRAVLEILQCFRESPPPRRAPRRHG